MIKNIFIDDKILEYIKKRWLYSQYEKSENYLKSWNFRQLKLKIREPKKDRIYYFRLNKQFRLWCKIDDESIKIFFIDNHQN